MMKGNHALTTAPRPRAPPEAPSPYDAAPSQPTHSRVWQASRIRLGAIPTALD